MEGVANHEDAMVLDSLLLQNPSWFYLDSKRRQIGPLLGEVLVNKLASEEITGNPLVFTHPCPAPNAHISFTDGKWLPLSEVKLLKKAFLSRAAHMAQQQQQKFSGGSVAPQQEEEAFSNEIQEELHRLEELEAAAKKAFLSGSDAAVSMLPAPTTTTTTTSNRGAGHKRGR